ncbi:MAG TPA: VWA domain-containing protein [Pyrinomonadaceae bacterium]|nr:VWA domain-containing protein [Pyrinomonadaceae bacterium]
MAVSAEAGRARQASSPAAAASEPSSVAIIVDNSTSMRDPAAAKHLGESLRRLVESGDARNEYFVFGVSTLVNVESGGRTDGLDAEGAAKALRRVLSARREGATALWDACVLAATKLASAKHTRRVLLVVSDGGDTLSTATPAETLNLLKLLRVRLSAVVTKPDKEPLIDRRAVNTLKRMAAESGGAFFEPAKGAEKDAVFESVRALVYP